MSSQTLQLPKEGEKIGSGILLSLISTGGSAYVYKTWVDALEIHRAVKVMSPDAAADVRDRFQTEARINSKLLHPYIVQCFNYGLTSSGLPFLEMEYLSGPSLAEVVHKRGALPLPVALAVTIGILEGLSYAHTIKYTLYSREHIGLIHRDLKPANIVISGDGNVKLMDFGIARPVDTSLHTLAGTVPGTVAYMPPEACSGGDCDFRSDIYQVGLCLYEFISGQPAFPQADLTSLLEAKSGNKFQSVEALVKNVDRRILPILKKCLHLDPTQRYQSAHLCLSDIRNLYSSLYPSIPPSQLILSYLSNQHLPPAPSFRHFPAALKNLALSAAIVCILCFSILLLLPRISLLLPALVKFYSSISTPKLQPSPAPMPPNVLHPVHPDTLIKPQPTPNQKQPNNPSVKSKPAVAHKTATPLATQQPSSDDALFYIEQGKHQYSMGRFSEAFTSFQSGLKMPSAKPRQEVVRNCIYWSAKCNSALYKSSQIPASNLLASWRSVLNTFPPNSAEFLEATTLLQELQE